MTRWMRPNNNTLTTPTAVWVWVSGAILSLVMGCCVTTLTVAAVVPLEELSAKAGEALSTEQLEQFQRIQPMLVPFTLGVFLLGFVPGLIYLVTGFGVRSGNRPSIVLTRWLIMIQLGWLVLVLVLNVLGLLIQRDMAGLFLSTLIYLPVLWLLYNTLKRLNRIHRNSETNLEISRDPWANP